MVITALDIISDPRTLYMNAPVGYPFAEKVEKDNIGGLKSFLINVFAQGDELAGDAIRNATQTQLIQTLLDNNFTFDPQWYAVRELPKGIDGKDISRLDDPVYRMQRGFTP